MFCEVAELPDKKAIVTEVQTWNTSVKNGPKGMSIPIKQIELQDPHQLEKCAEPKLLQCLTIDDLKMRAKILAYSKFKYKMEQVKNAQVKKTLLSIISIVR